MKSALKLGSFMRQRRALESICVMKLKPRSKQAVEIGVVSQKSITSARSGHSFLVRSQYFAGHFLSPLVMQ